MRFSQNFCFGRIYSNFWSQYAIVNLIEIELSQQGTSLKINSLINNAFEIPFEIAEGCQTLLQKLF